VDSISVDVLIELLSTKRRDNNLSKNFIIAFREFVKLNPSTTEQISESLYFKWILNRISKVSKYRHARQGNLESILLTCMEDLKLFHDIEKKGIQTPIRIFYEAPYGMEIDGYHRLCIAKELKMPEIRYELSAIHACESPITRQQLDSYVASLHEGA